MSQKRLDTRVTGQQTLREEPADEERATRPAKAHLPDEHRQRLGLIKTAKVPESEVRPSGVAPAAPSSEGAHQPEDDQQEPKSRLGTIIFFAACALVLLILVGAVWYSNHRAAAAVERDRYNGFLFQETTTGFWVTQVQARGQLYEIPFYFHPKDTEFIPTDYDAVRPVYSNPAEIYISLDPDAGATPVVAAAEISRLTGNKYNLFNIPTRGALSRPDPTVGADIPVLDCRNATQERVIIQFIPGRSNAIARGANEHCVILQYVDGNESKRVADRYAYMLLKIVQ